MKRISLAVLAVMILGMTGSAAGTTLFALVDTGEMYASDDQGASWSVRSTLPISDAAGLVAGSSSSVLYLTSVTGAVYRSADAGNTWTAVGSVGASDVADLSGHSGGDLLAVTHTGTVYESTDLGASWSGKGVITASKLVSLAVGANTNLYALTETGEISESTDDGATWNTVGAIPVSDAVEIRRFDDALAVLTETGFTYLSDDDGGTWVAAGTVSQVGMSGLTHTGSDLVAVSKEGLVARSGDGTDWNWVGSVNQLNVIALANDNPTVTGIPENPTLPAGLVLAPIRPNPLSLSQGQVHITFDLPGPDAVSLSLFDIRGRRVAERPPQAFSTGGTHSVDWSLGGQGLGSGVYFLRLSGRGHADRPITLLR